MKSLEIRDLHVEVEGKEILKGVDLTIQENEIHALMGPNGNGKSTLLAAVMGHPKYRVTQGSITYDGKNLLEMPVDERSKAGVFLAMQYPQDIPGVKNMDFLRAAMNARREKPVPLFNFIKSMEKTIKDLDMKEDLASRYVNEGFSGGEKKRNEIVQMEMLQPSFAMLDEIDSGLDVDALHIVANALNQLHEQNHMSMLIVSHYERFYELVQPQFCHVLVDGRIVLSGGPELTKKIDQEGYDWLYQQYGVQPAAEAENARPRVSSIGVCAANPRVRGNAQ